MSFWQRLRWRLKVLKRAGHFYAPTTDPDRLHADAQRLWPADPPDPPGIDLRLEAQRRFLREALPPALADYDFPALAPAGPPSFHEPNGQYDGFDPRLLWAQLRHEPPQRIVEVGSGFSTLLIAEWIRRHAPATRLTCIEPYPRPFLAAALAALGELRREPVQQTPAAVFDTLGPGDVLFIDSSHVVKTGSDVVHLYLSVLPRLAPGVRVHVHDIFLPADYPPAWAIAEHRDWNEQYLLQALLLDAQRWRVEIGAHCAFLRLKPDLAAALGRTPEQLPGGAAFWFRRTG